MYKYRSLETCLVMAVLHILRPIVNYRLQRVCTHASDYNNIIHSNKKLNIQMKVFQGEISRSTVYTKLTHF